MAKYTLHYFNVQARAEPIRYMLAHGVGADGFTDHRVDGKTEWPALKESMPTGTMPVLELEDGRRLSQTIAICRYLGRELGLDGSDSWEKAKIDEMAELRAG